MKSFTFRLFKPPSTHGPDVRVAREDIVAVAQSYDSVRGHWLALLHLRGGSTLLLDNAWSDVVAKVYGAADAA